MGRTLNPTLNPRGSGEPEATQPVNVSLPFAFEQAAAADAEAVAAKVKVERDRLLSDPTLMPCMNWETVSRGCNDDGWQLLMPMAAEAEARHEAAAAAE